jgi:hypothetical protein
MSADRPVGNQPDRPVGNQPDRPAALTRRVPAAGPPLGTHPQPRRYCRRQ